MSAFHLEITVSSKSLSLIIKTIPAISSTITVGIYGFKFLRCSGLKSEFQKTKLLFLFFLTFYYQIQILLA